LKDIENFLQNTLGLPDGGSVSLRQLLHYEVIRGKGNIRHYNLRRTVTVEAELNKQLVDTVTVNRLIQSQWSTRFAEQFPNVALDLTGELDDIQESIDAIMILFLLGIGLIYTILGSQFKSYIQPLIVLVTVPMAFMGVVYGLLISQNPLSLYTLYGIVALAGIAVNAAIVLISAANEWLQRGMSVSHATVYAAKRRVIPILITSLTTIAGLFALAAGLGGKSLLWGPLATSIVWGLAVSTLLTLFVIPLLYCNVVKKKPLETEVLPLPRPLTEASASKLNQFLAQFRVGLLTGTSRTQQFKALTAIAACSDLRAFYMEGRRLLMEKEYEQALNIFTKIIQKAPDNGIPYICAAQALLLYMQKEAGWNIDSLDQAKHYIKQAEKLVPGDKRLPLLRRVYRSIKNSSSDRSRFGTPPPNNSRTE
jgi:tetratricopeptide (TPR) repeat protein